MQLLDLTLGDPAADLALDEALLDAAEAGECGETLRLWSPAAPLVVLGRASRIAEEANLAACQARGAPVLRRCSGGAAIVAGPGCLMYALVLDGRRRPAALVIDQAHRCVLERLVEALAPLAARAGSADPVARQGLSDLTLGPRKFSGNSLRLKRTHALYHGTLLHGFPLAQIGELLGVPPRQPDYRAGRTHAEFVCNFPAAEAELRAALSAAWAAETPLVAWPAARTERLVAERYGREEWSRQR